MELSFVQAVSLTFLIEVIILYALLRNYPPLLVFRNALIANALTHPVVWFVFPALGFGFGLGYLLQVALSELFAFAVETAVYVALFPKMELRQAVLASFICNAVSFLVGLALVAF